MADSSDQGPSCRLLNGHLPREVRNMIYGFTFEGAQVIFSPFLLSSTDRSDAFKINKGFIVTKNLELLLTCRQAYIEGRPIFCAAVQLSLKYCDVDCLANAVSDFTRTHVRQLVAISEDFPRIDEAAKSLRRFPGVQVCILGPSFTFVRRLGRLGQLFGRDLFPSPPATALLDTISRMEHRPLRVPIVKMFTRVNAYKGRLRVEVRFSDAAGVIADPYTSQVHDMTSSMGQC